jgi:hypothetical protein
MKASHARGWKRIRNSGFNVRFGSKAAVNANPNNVRYTPVNGHRG